MNNQEVKEQERATVSAFTVDSFANGVAFGQHRAASGDDPRDIYYLRLQDEGEFVKLRSRYVLHHSSPFIELERHLMRLSQAGILGTSEIYFGTSSDPFLPFDGKFNASIKFLEIFQRYTPGMLHIQTRSPLVVIGMPVLKKLGKHVSVTIGLETNKEEVNARLCPGIPRVEERLKTATALRRFGIEVSLQVGPVLPYGDWKNDAGEFAQLLVENADYIHVRPLINGTIRNEKKVRSSLLGRALTAQRQFHWLRPDAATPLITEIEKRAPEKLLVPQREHMKAKQLSIFAA